MITSSILKSFGVSSLCTSVYLPIVLKMCSLHEVIVKNHFLMVQYSLFEVSLNTKLWGSLL